MEVRPYQPADGAALVSLLAPLQQSYPDAQAWLARRREQLDAAKSWAFVAEDDGELVGALLFAPQARGAPEGQHHLLRAQPSRTRPGSSAVDVQSPLVGR